MAVANTLAYYVTAIMTSVKSFITQGRIHNPSFSSQLTNKPNKLVCLSMPCLSSLVQCNTSSFGTYVSYEENEGL
jgi:hypothetical protein